MEELKRKRGVIKGQLTRLQTYVAGFNQDPNADRFQLSARLEKIDLLWSDFNKCQDEIETLNPEDAEREVFENAYFSVVARANKIIDALKPRNVTVESRSVTPTDGNLTNNIQPNLKLPTLKLMEFNGDYSNFTEFKDIFQSLIDSNASLSNIQRLYYLKSCLRGEAAHLLQNIQVSESNYDLCWQLLKERYDNKRVIVNSHLKSIFDLSVINRESASALRHLLDNLKRDIRCLEALGLNVKTWDSILIFLVSAKLDFQTKKEWETSLKGSSLPTFEQFETFLNERCQILESLNTHRPVRSIEKYSRLDSRYTNFAAQRSLCPFCGSQHFIAECKIFLNNKPKDRFSEIKRLNRCVLCLKENHAVKNCKSNSKCALCGRLHSTLLCFAKVDSNDSNNLNEKQSYLSAQLNTISTDNMPKSTGATNNLTNNDEQPSLTAHSFNNKINPFIKNNKIILLSTAILYIFDIDNKPIKCRCLLDSGSQSNFLSLDLFTKLKLSTYNNYKPIMGINGKVSNIHHKTYACIKSLHNEYNKNVEFLILDNITGNIPPLSFNFDFEIPNDIKLADPDFNKSGRIDMLLGAGVYWALMRDGLISLGPNKPFLQNTALGHIFGGQLLCNNASKKQSANFCGFSLENKISNQLEKFWKIEECENKKFNSIDDNFCERHFIENVYKNNSGKFVVKLPLVKDVSCLGNSLQTAISRFFALERKFYRDPKIKNDYVEFMNEYIELGHMSKIDKSQIHLSDFVYYIPHHPVIKTDSLTTKLRVVFDGSCKTSTGFSLNDILLVGPTIQDDLFSILLRFRKHSVVLIADIAKMYRMIYVHPSQRDLQRIIWRDSPDKELEHYTLNTVTYGLAPSAFLAIRCLRESAEKYKEIFPLAYEAIIKGFYVDDLNWGAEDINSAKLLKSQITDILKESGFELRKFLSNEPSIISESDQPDTPFYAISDGSSTKALGILWDSKNDILGFSVNKTNISEKITKRYMLSKISQIFDPLGLVGPVIIRAKILLQELWKSKLAWDDSVPENITKAFLEFEKDIIFLNSLKVPRHAFCSQPSNIELHGFSDASQKAYGACIFVKSRNQDGFLVKLLCAKSRVAPLKTISLPRLELCGFVLLNKLMNQVGNSLQLSSAEIYFWTDSTITLSWLAAEPSTWKTFVANRVSEIQRTSLSKNYNFVKSADNPADIISRGTDAVTLMQSSLWLHGPSWLRLDKEKWPIYANTSHETEKLPEFRKQTVLTTTELDNFDIFERYSSLYRLQCVTAYCRRFFYNLKSKNGLKLSGKLSTEEIDSALICLIRLAQKQTFNEEIRCLTTGKVLKNKSNLLCLNPFVDSNGLLLLGGRLKNADILYSQKHPILLPQSHQLTKLLVQYEHVRLQHAGPQLVLSTLRLKYWIINGRTVVRGVLRKCVKCFRAKPSFSEPIMGDLPKHRVTPTRPFYNCSVDFGGPFKIKDGITKSRKYVKTYICLFICCSTKAIHIELAGDLSTPCFLNCLKRFMSRRGFVKNIWSDNATNFVGANNEIVSIFEKVANSSVSKYLLESRVSWHFIPPHAPNFGGLHERAIGSCKFHLNRVMADVNLHYESFITLLNQVEAIINSRPLTPLSSDPTDLNPLTPGHFLIGAQLMALPEDNLQDIPTNRLSKYQALTQCIQKFWKRWHLEYVTNLQQRSKNKRSHGAALKVGDMVILKEDGLPPMQWCLGRIVEVFPGKDDVVRVVVVKTKSGLLTRAYSKVAVLPIEN